LTVQGAPSKGREGRTRGSGLAERDETAGLSFEDALKRLEAIVRELESGNAPLDRSITLYEEGERLKRRCEALLKDAETRIRQLQLDSAGKPVGEEPFAD